MSTSGTLSAVITTIRHGEKDDMGELTEQGRSKASSKGLLIEDLFGDVILLHSGVNRVKETIEHTFRNMPNASNKKNDIQSYTSHYLHYLHDPANKGDYFKKWEEVNGNKGAEHKRMKNFLALENKSSEPAIYPSPKEMAVRLSRVIATEIDFATITVPEVRTNFINGSHEPVMMAFLYYFLQDFQPKNPNFLEDIKGTLDFTEGFEIKVYQNLKENNQVIFSFRDIIKELDQKLLKDFCRSI